MSILTVEERELLKKATALMEELLETLEVMQDKELVLARAKALGQVKTDPDWDLPTLTKSKGFHVLFHFFLIY